MGLSANYTHFLNYAKVFIVVFWAFCLGISIAVGPKFLTRTKDSFESPPGSASTLADELLVQTFPSQKETSNFGVYIYTSDNSTVFGSDLRQFTLDLKKSVELYPRGTLMSYTGYYAFIEQGIPEAMAQDFVGPNNTSTIISISTTLIDEAAVEFAKFVQKSMNRLKPPNATWNMALTGIPAFVETIYENIENDFALMDGIVLPIAIGLLAILLRSVRLLILPLLCIATSSMVTFSLMYAITFIFDIVSFAPSLMMSLLIAMSIDYSLFLLSRYREELLSGATAYDSVQTSIGTAGHTILVSGTTLAACFLGLVLLPLNLMKSLGIACSITLVITMMVNLSLIPSLLLLFPKFFSRSIQPFDCKCCILGYGSIQFPPDGTEVTSFVMPRGSIILEKDKNDVHMEPINDHFDSDKSDHQHSDDSSDEQLISGSASQKLRVQTGEATSGISPSWYKFGKLMLKFPFNVIVILVIVGLSIPFNIHAAHYPTSDSLEMTMPSHSPVTKTYQAMASDFGYGFLYPYIMILVPPKDNPEVLTRPFFNNVTYIIETLANGLVNTTVNDFTGLLYAQGQQAPFFFVEGCIKETIPASFCGIISWTAQMFLNPHRNATFFYVRLRFNPLDAEGFEWYFEALKIAKNLTEETGVDIRFAGIGATSMDAIEAVNDSFYRMILVTVGVVLLFVAISFRSILLPFRSVLTIGLTLLFVYGFADLVYVEGMFSWMGFFGLHKWGSIYWAPPIVSFSIIVGIGLDYDIFLLVRIKEFRDLGYSTAESIVLGFSKTGHIITAAGVIMAIAFSGLLFSDISGMTMLSFYMVFSVLFDTFVVRTLLVPSMMSLGRDANWWPGAVPEVTLEYDKEIGTSFAGGPCWCAKQRNPDIE